jgi:hypothetical protein
MLVIGCCSSKNENSSRDFTFTTRKQAHKTQQINQAVLLFFQLLSNKC